MICLKFAVIGSAHGHITEFIDDMISMGHEFAGIYDDKSPLVSRLSERYNVPVYDDMEILFDTGIEIAGTSAINNQKIDIIEECSRRGVHVIADKPIVIDQQQYERLERVTGRGNIQVGMMLSVRFDPCVSTLKKLVDQGVIGKLLSVEIFNPHRLGAANRPAWHFKKNQNGGIIIDLIVHSVDLFNWLTQSEIADYKGVMVKSILPEKEDFYDSSQYFVRSENNVTGYFRVDWHMTDTHWTWGDLRVFCTGTRGSMEARVLGDPLTKGKLLILFEEGKETRSIELDENVGSVTKDFINRVQGREYIVGHKDILLASRNAIELDREAERIRFV